MTAWPTEITIIGVQPGSAESQAVLTAYFRDVMHRPFGREPTIGEVEAEMTGTQR